MAHITRLANGLTSVCEERPGTGKVSMGIFIKRGSAEEPLDENGLTYLAQECVNGGTTTRSRRELADAIETRGSQLVTETTREHTVFSLNALTRHAEDLFAVLADAVRNPALAPEEIEKTKKLVGSKRLKDAEDPDREASLAFFEAAFANQPLGARPMGSAEMVASFTPEQVRARYAELLEDPSKIVVAGVGDITAARMAELTAQYFGDLPAAVRQPEPLVSTFTGGDIREEKDNNQLNIRFGFRAPSLGHPDHYAAIMMDELIGRGMSSPLFQEVREKRGLVYSVSSAYKDIGTEGIFSVMAGTGEGNAGELVRTVFDLLGTVARDGFTDEKMAQVRERFLRITQSDNEASANAAEAHAETLFKHGREMTVDEYREKLSRVTSDDVRRVCASMLAQDDYALAAIGPQDTMPTPDEIRQMMRAQLDGVVIPPSADPVPSAVPEFIRVAAAEPAFDEGPHATVLPNGTTVITVGRPGLLALGAWLDVGADDETNQRGRTSMMMHTVWNGISHMGEHMMFTGSPNYPRGSIDRTIEGALGGDLNAETERDSTCYYFYNLLPSAREKAIDIAFAMVYRANLDQAEFDGKMSAGPDGTPVKNKGERDVVIEEINMYADETASRAEDLLRAVAYPGQSYGRPILGTEETIRAMTVEDMAAFRDTYYTPNNVVISVVGPVRHAEVVAQVAALSAGLKPAEIPQIEPPRFTGGTGVAEMDAANLCTVRLYADGVPLAHPDIHAYKTLATILGAGASSRLYRDVVVNRQLAGDIEAHMDSFNTAGALRIKTAAEPGDVRPLLDAIYGVLRDAPATITQAELDKNTQRMELAMLEDFETSWGACARYALAAQTYGRMTTPADLTAKIQAVTLDDVRRVAQAIAASPPAAAMIVPEGTDPQLLPVHDEVVDIWSGKKQAFSNTSPRFSKK